MNKLGTAAILVLFVVGLVGGVSVSQLTRTRAPVSPYPALPVTGEPAAAAEVVAAIANDDARALARLLDGTLLDTLGQALDPVLQVYDVKFVGASEKAGDTLSAYVVQGRALQGDQLLVGVVFRVRGDKVVAVN